LGLALRRQFLREKFQLFSWEYFYFKAFMDFEAKFDRANLLQLIFFKRN
jgi:hypothetical protein